MPAPWISVPVEVEGQDTPSLTQLRYDIFVAKLFKYDTSKVMQLHAAVVVAEEAGELAGCIKKHAVYNKPLSDAMKEDGKTLKQHIIEEAGDVMFYLQACLNQFGLDFQEVLQYNAIKRMARYKDLTYSDEKANARLDKPSHGQEEC